jgi:hypothetical protein
MTSGFHRHNGFLFLSGSGLSLGANTTLLLTLAPFCIKIMAQLQTENIKIMAQLQTENIKIMAQLQQRISRLWHNYKQRNKPVSTTSCIN